jgi:hypothetical protein
MEDESFWTKAKIIVGSLAVILPAGWACWKWFRTRFTKTASPIAVTRCAQDDSKAGATYEMKVYVWLENTSGVELRLSHAYFRFESNPRLAPDPIWNEQFDTAKGAYRCFFRNPDPSKRVHDQQALSLPYGQKTSVWIGIDPVHSLDSVKRLLGQGHFGKLEFTVTTQTGLQPNAVLFSAPI